MASHLLFGLSPGGIAAFDRQMPRYPHLRVDVEFVVERPHGRRPQPRLSGTLVGPMMRGEIRLPSWLVALALSDELGL